MYIDHILYSFYILVVFYRWVFSFEVLLIADSGVREERLKYYKIRVQQIKN